METQDLVEALLCEDAPENSLWVDIGGEQESTRLELRVQVAALTRRYRIQGIGPGATVAVRMCPSYTLVWTLLALWKLGAQVLLLHPDHDVRTVLNRWRPQFFLRSGGFGPCITRFVQECEVVVYARPASVAARTDHCLVQVVSDGTGPPRLVGRDAAGLLAELHRLRALPDAPRATERVLLAAPLVQSAWLVGGLLYALFCGATLVLPQDRSRSDREIVADVLLSTPAGLQDVRERLARSPLRLAVIAGGAVPAHDAVRFRRHFGTALGRIHQTAEAGIVACDLTGRYSSPAIGPALDGVRLRIRHRELHVLLHSSPDVEAPVGPFPRWWRTEKSASITSNGVLVVWPTERAVPAHLTRGLR